MKAKFGATDPAALRLDAEARMQDPAAGDAASTVRNERFRWDRTRRWWGAHGAPGAVSEPDVLRFLTAHEGHSHGTLRNAVTTISAYHLAEFKTDPCGEQVVKFLEGYAKLVGTAVRPVDALRPDEFNRLVAAAPGVLSPFIAARFVAALTLIYGGALRPGEGLRAGCDEILADTLGYAVFLPWSKTDRVGDGATCPIDLPDGVADDFGTAFGLYVDRAAEAGIILTGHTPLFPSTMDPDRSISVATFYAEMCRVAAAAGITRRIRPYSLRRGRATQAAREGKTLEEILALGRWARVANAAFYIEIEDRAAPDLQLDYGPPA